MKRRLYESGTGSCVWRWSDVVLDGVLYLRRLHLVKVQLGRFGFAVMLHWILRPDPQPDLHDHPVSFASVILRGAYLEHRWGPHHYREKRCYAPGDINWMRATDCHRILDVLPRTMTLVFAGPKTREWGFHTASGWVDWRTYSAPRRS